MERSVCKKRTRAIHMSVPLLLATIVGIISYLVPCSCQGGPYQCMIICLCDSNDENKSTGPMPAFLLQPPVFIFLAMLDVLHSGHWAKQT